ncbi:MAG: hypothetical protein LBB66_09515 [Desulfovibrio sp.]|jgi:hypothetical protein|nr:hypothetical protein [Desulfovibrio sp.]
MGYFLFVDESGHDGTPPYEVLAGVALEDRQRLALSCLQKGDGKEQPARAELTALAQAKIAFVHGVADLVAYIISWGKGYMAK